MRNFFKNKKEKKRKTKSDIDRQELEKKVTMSAEKTLKNYHRVFERLAEFDRT